MFKKISLRMRLTIITGLIIVCTSVLLTAMSIYNANVKFFGNENIAVTLTPLKKSTAPVGTVDIITPAEDFDVAGMEMTESVMAAEILQKAKRGFDFWSYIYLLIIILVGMAVAYILSSRALRPVKVLNSEIEKIGENNLSQRIPESMTKDEIGSLTCSFNAMLDRMEESFNRQKQFSSNVAHELKTPLATIKSGIQVLNLDENPTVEEYKENINITESSTNRLIQVVDDLLMLTAENQCNFDELISLKGTIDLITQELLYVAKDKNVTFDKNVENIYISGSGSLFYRALFNIIENAVKYNKDGGTVKIQCLSQDERTHITVTDTGIGIPKDEIKNILEPFYRVDKSRSREIAGSGLGLSMVKTIVDKHNGTLDIQSQVGIGTVVDIIL